MQEGWHEASGGGGEGPGAEAPFLGGFFLGLKLHA